MQVFPKIENGRKSHLSDLTSQFTELNPFSGFSWVIRVIFLFWDQFSQLYVGEKREIFQISAKKVTMTAAGDCEKRLFQIYPYPGTNPLDPLPLSDRKPRHVMEVRFVQGPIL